MELKGENISKRFLDITIEILKLIKKLPTDYSGLHSGKQLLRSSTSNIIAEFTELSNIIANSIITVQNKSKK